MITASSYDYEMHPLYDSTPEMANLIKKINFAMMFRSNWQRLTLSKAISLYIILTLNYSKLFLSSDLFFVKEGVWSRIIHGANVDLLRLV